MNIQHIPTSVEKVRVGSFVDKGGKIREVTDIRAHGYPRTEEGKAAVFSITLDGHWSIAYKVGEIIDIVIV